MFKSKIGIRIKNEYTKNGDSEIKIWTIYYG